MPKTLDLLRAVYSTSLREDVSGAEGISGELSEPANEVREGIEKAAKEGLLSIRGQEVRLTEKGRSQLKVVMIGGAFEIIHPGHLHTMAEAKKLGNTLVVVVATDKSVSKNKGRDPVTTQEWRVKLVAALKIVDAAIAGAQGSIYDTLEKVRPDMVALGYDQTHNPAEIENEAKRRGLDIKVVRLTTPMPDIKTSKIVSTL
jgi:FAD synthetase